MSASFLTAANGRASEVARQQNAQDIEIEALLRRLAIKAHLSDEDTYTAFSRSIADIEMPDRIVEHPALPQPVRLRQVLSGERDENDAIEMDWTGGLQWDSSSIVMDWLLTAPQAKQFLVGGTVLELGAGLGLLSIVLAVLGAGHVTCTDGVHYVCQAARANVTLNGVAEAVHVERLEWGNASQLERALASYGGRSPQTIVASDVLYDEEGMNLFEQTVRAIVARGGCRHVVLGWRDRGHGELEYLSSRFADLGTARTVWTALPSGPAEQQQHAPHGGTDQRNAGVSVLEIGV